MGIAKSDVQCISFGTNIHPLHKTWMQEVSSRKIISYIPEHSMWLKKSRLLSQAVSFFRGLFVPSAKAYFIEGVGAVPAVYFKRGKVIAINSDTFFYNMQKSKLNKMLSKILLWRIDGFISTSTMMHEKAVSAKKPSLIAYPYIDDSQKSLFKLHPNFNNNNICIVAGTRYVKGIDIVINSFKKYKKIHHNAQLFVLGKDAYWQNEIKKAGGTAPGHVAIAPYLKKASIYVNPARHDSFGINIIEAMAAGIPPIISEYCGAKEFVSKIDKKLICPLDADELVKRIEWLKSDKKRYMKQSTESRKIALQFTKQKSIASMKRAFEKLTEFA